MPQEIWNELIKVAEQDGIVSEDEAKLVEKVLESAEKYEALLKDALEDNIITDDEKRELHTMRVKILQSGLFQALADVKVTDDELKLLTKVREILVSLHKELN